MVSKVCRIAGLMFVYFYFCMFSFLSFSLFFLFFFLTSCMIFGYFFHKVVSPIMNRSTDDQ